MKTRLGMAIVLLWPSLHAVADSPPSWTEFDRSSANKEFVAKVTVKDKNGKDQRYEWSYSLAIYKADEATPLWSCTYPYHGYPGGIVSDDGKFFVNVSFWYYDDIEVVSIYSEGKLVKTYNGKDFSLDKTKLKKTVSHRLWRAENSGPSFDDVNDLVIPSIDGQVFRVNLKTLKLRAEQSK